jgi:hypothetical protein
MPPNTLSTARITIPAEKHELATECCLRRDMTKARALLNAAATKAGVQFEFTIRACLISGTGLSILFRLDHRRLAVLKSLTESRGS